MKALVVVAGPDGVALEGEVELPEEVAQAVRTLDEAPPEISREAFLIADLLRGFSDVGNHDLYALYRKAGGRQPWKLFRRIIAHFRRGDAGPAATVSEQMVERRRQKMAERAAAKQRAIEARAKREKEKEMATIRREDLRRGQHVYVRVRYGDQMKLRPAKINEVMRAAVNLLVDGEDRPRTVRFNEIELSTDSTDKKPTTQPTLAAVPQAFAALGGPAPPEKRHPHVHVEVRREPVELDRRNSLQDDPKRLVPPPAPPPEPSSPPRDDLGQVNAWIQQGAAMREGLVKKQESLQAEVDDLAAEALRIEEAIAAKKAEMARVTAMLTAIDQIRGVVAA
jgi:hypothetical protein